MNLRNPVLLGVIATSALWFGATQQRGLAQERTILMATTPAALRMWDSSIDRMVRAGELHLRRADLDTMLADRRHERFDQYYKGVTVLGGDVVRQMANGLTVSLFGSVYPDIDLDVTPALSVADAAAVVKAQSGVDLGPSKLPKLLILPEESGYRLVYRATAFQPHGGTDYFIDAKTGAIVRTRDAVRHQAAVGTGSGVLGDTKKMSVTASSGGFQANDLLRPPVLRTYDMKGNVGRMLAYLNGLIEVAVADRAFDSDNVWTDRAAVDAHAHAGYVYDYYFKRFNRRGLDNNNLPIFSFVHPVARASIDSQPDDIVDSFFLNAGYYGDGIMVYGEGLPPGYTLNAQRWDYLAGGLDVVGHELTHGVTDFTSGLIYQNESGALNESFSDMLGTAVEFFLQTPGDGPLRGDYLIGEDVITPGGLRSLSNPGTFGDPDHYLRRYTGTADNGGVHINCGIPNQMYYLAIEGGTNRTSGLSVQGVGFANREQIERVMYRAFTQLMPSNATFAVARVVTIQAARDLYGTGSNAERAITQAWTAVGVN